MSNSKIAVLTNAQFLTLLRMNSGTKYAMSGNLRYGLERRTCIRTGEADDKCCPSLKPLMNKGYIKFSISPKSDNSFYPVEMTDSGKEMVNQFKEKINEF